MKNLLLLLTLISSSAFSYIVEDIEQSTMLIAACPICTGGSLVTTTTFKVSKVSCGKFADNNIIVDVKKESLGISGDSETFVTIKTDGPLLDCAGPTRKHEYTVSTEKLVEGERYVLRNASVL